MKITMVHGVQGEYQKTLEPGKTYVVGADLTKSFARQILDRGAGYINEDEALGADAQEEPASVPVTGKKGK